MMCPKCGSDRVVEVVTDHHSFWFPALRCLACWWSSMDWARGHLRPVTTRIEYEPTVTEHRRVNE